MNNTYEIIKNLAKKRGISIKRLEENLGFGNGNIKRWEKSTPGIDKVQAVADYFHVTVDYILGKDKTEPEIIDLSEEDAVFAFDGKPVSKEEREMLAAVIAAHRANKK